MSTLLIWVTNIDTSSLLKNILMSVMKSSFCFMLAFVSSDSSFYYNFSFSSVNLAKKKLFKERICLIGAESILNWERNSLSSSSYSPVIFFVGVGFGGCEEAPISLLAPLLIWELALSIWLETLFRSTLWRSKDPKFMSASKSRLFRSVMFVLPMFSHYLDIMVQFL